MDTNHTTATTDDIDAIFHRRVYDHALAGWVDPVTGRTWPDIRGGEGDTGNRDDDPGTDLDDSDGDADDHDDDTDTGVDEDRIKAERSGYTKGKRDTLRKLGFGTMAEARAALTASEPADTAASPEPAAPTGPNRATDRAVLSADVAKAVALSGIRTEKLETAATLVEARLDLDDEPDAHDIATAIDSLRTAEPAWFTEPGTNDGTNQGDGRGQGVPGPTRKTRQTPPSNHTARTAAIDRLKAGGWR